MLYICFSLKLNIIDMVQLEIELPGEKLGWLGFVEENIAVEESLRLHFYGFLSEERNLTNLVMIELPEGLKLRRNSRLRRKEYEGRRLMGSLPELPFWKKIHEGEDYVEVDFEAEIERLTKEEDRLSKELARVNGMLSNEKFISKAPETKINEEIREKEIRVIGPTGDMLGVMSSNEALKIAEENDDFIKETSL